MFACGYEDNTVIWHLKYSQIHCGFHGPESSSPKIHQAGGPVYIHPEYEARPKSGARREIAIGASQCYAKRMTAESNQMHPRSKELNTRSNQQV